MLGRWYQPISLLSRCALVVQAISLSRESLALLRHGDDDAGLRGRSVRAFMKSEFGKFRLGWWWGSSSEKPNEPTRGKKSPPIGKSLMVRRCVSPPLGTIKSMTYVASEQNVTR